jgi:hypothetical protein
MESCGLMRSAGRTRTAEFGRSQTCDDADPCGATGRSDGSAPFERTTQAQHTPHPTRRVSRFPFYPVPSLMRASLQCVSNSDRHTAALRRSAASFGWADAGWHRPANYSDVQSPHMDSLVREGVELNRHYVFQFCSPTRSAMQSGRNPIHVRSQRQLVCLC